MDCSPNPPEASRLEVREVEIHGIAAGGSGVGRLEDGRVVFVPRTAPGDKAVIEIVQDRGRWVRGRLCRLVRAGGTRRVPACRYFARCGGCTLQHLAMPAQLQWKRRIVLDALSRIGGIQTELESSRPSPRVFRYRSRATFHLRRLAGGRVLAGFHQLERPGRIVDVDGRCLVLDDCLVESWDGLRRSWGPAALRLPAGDRLDLTLQSVDRGAVLTVRGGRGRGEAAELLQEVPDLVAIWRHREGYPPKLLAGDPTAAITRGMHRIRSGGSTFVQVNPYAAEVMAAELLRLAKIEPGIHVVDAYAGGGIYGHAFAREGARVTAIERDPAAVRAARRRGPPGLTVVQGSVEDHLDEALPATLVVVNPPRGGLHGRVTSTLVRRPPKRILYVSCDPATLARDLGRLSASFSVDRVVVFDLFPQTSHVETLVELRRAGDDGSAETRGRFEGQ